MGQTIHCQSAGGHHHQNQSKRSLLTMATPTHPRQLFFDTHEQRVSLARQQYFEEGKRPTGLVSESLIQSWSRCHHSSLQPHQKLRLDLVTASRIHTTLGRNRQLLEAASAQLKALEMTLAGTTCRALLTDATGVIVHASQSHGPMNDRLMPRVCRIGVNLAEGLVGTNAPGVVIKTGQGCSVQGNEHFFQDAQSLHCVAAPIHDNQGRLAAVLDLSIESRPFGFDAMSLVTQYAIAIENGLLLASAKNQLVLHLHTSPHLINTPFEALLGINEDGCVDWMNDLASRLAGSSDPHVEARFGMNLSQLEGLLGREAPQLIRLPSGLAVWALTSLHVTGSAVHRQTDTGAPPDVQALTSIPPVAAPSPLPAESPASKPLAKTSLDDLRHRHIEQALTDCGGNISRAARALGVSRGLIYRYLDARTVPS